MSVYISLQPDPQDWHNTSIVHILRDEGRVRSYHVRVGSPSMNRLYRWIVDNHDVLNRQHMDGLIRYTLE